MASYSVVRGTRMRVTVTDECGTPSTGAGDSVVTDGFVTVSYSPEQRDRDEIELENAGGFICVSDSTQPQLKWYNLEMEFCQVNPDLFAILTNQTVVDDWEMESVGVTIGTDTVAGGFALEVWSKIPGQDCTGGQTAHGYTLVPWASEGVFDDFTIENDALTFTISARTFGGGGWGQGPYDVVEQDGATPPTAGPLLDPLASDSHLHLQRTFIDPPAVP